MGSNPILSATAKHRKSGAFFVVAERMSDVKLHRLCGVGFAFSPQSDNSSLIGGKAKKIFAFANIPNATAKHRNSGAFFSYGGENVGCEVTPLMR